MRLHHIGLVVPDIDAGVRFYATAFDFKVVFSGGWEAPSDLFDGITGLSGSAAKTAFLSGPCGYLELFEYDSPHSVANPSVRRASDFGIRHFCIESEAPETLLQALLAAGGAIEGTLTVVPGGAAAVYCRDPFGNIIEILKPGGRIPSLDSHVSVS